MHWGYDNRTDGLPRAALRARRRGAWRTACPSSDANPYLAIAASLACGYLGMVEGLEPTDADRGRAPRTRSYRAAARAPRCGAALGDRAGARRDFRRGFVRTYRAIKETEFETFMRVISPWEREYLLLSV